MNLLVAFIGTVLFTAVLVGAVEWFCIHREAQ